MLATPRVRFSTRLGNDTPSYYDAGVRPEIVLNPELWARTCNAGRMEIIAREAAHHVLQAIYPLACLALQYWSACREEERGRRLALRCLVPDAAVLDAFALGDSEPWELAERWGRTPEWCADRVALFFVDHPGLRQFMRPEAAV
jgi:hypothetical protein